MTQQHQLEKTMDKTKTKVHENFEQRDFQNVETVQSKEDFERELRKPRSKKRMRILSSVDLPNLTDQEIMERMAQETGIDIASGDITQEDICAYLAKCEAEFVENIQQEMAQEEKEREEKQRVEEEKHRKEEERRRMMQNRDSRLLQSCLCKCYISGCEVHAIPKQAGWKGVQHFKKGEIPQDFSSAYDLFKENPRCNCVEIYEEFLVSITGRGEVIKLVKR